MLDSGGTYFRFEGSWWYDTISPNRYLSQILLGPSDARPASLRWLASWLLRRCSTCDSEGLIKGGFIGTAHCATIVANEKGEDGRESDVACPASERCNRATQLYRATIIKTILENRTFCLVLVTG
jgi:hypothetical protein